MGARARKSTYLAVLPGDNILILEMFELFGGLFGVVECWAVASLTATLATHEECKRVAGGRMVD